MVMDMESITAFACNSTCASELFLGFNNDPSNVTDLCSQLAQCPGFCEAAFETENLDLAGKGIRISTIIQGSLAISIGAIFPILIYLTRTLPIRPLVPRIPLLQDIKHKIHKINAFFTLCLLISITLQSARTSRPVLETAFLPNFVVLEMFITITFYWGIMVDNNINSNPLGGTFFTYLAMIGAQWFLVSKIAVPHQNFYRMLVHGCRTQSTAAVGLTPGLNSNVTTAQGLDIKPHFGDEVSAKQAFLWILPFYLVCGVVLVLLAIFKNKLPGWLKRHGKAIGWAFVLALFSTDIFVNTWKLGYQTQLVQMMRGKDLPPQNDWDFGQTTALMIWLPVASELLTVIRKWRNPPVATSEKKIAAGVEKAVATPVTDERQLELGSDECGKLTVTTPILVEHGLPRAEKTPPPYHQPSEAASGDESLPRYEPLVSDVP